MKSAGTSRRTARRLLFAVAILTGASGPARAEEPVETTRLQRATDDYDQKRFLAAYRRAADVWPQLAHIDSDSLLGVAGLSYRPGQAGLDRSLRITLPLAAIEWRDDVSAWSFAAGRIETRSDRPQQGAAIGSAEGGAFAYAPTRAVSGDAWQIGYRHDSRLAPYFSFGQTPVVDGLASPLHATLGATVDFATQRWDVQLFRRPVEDSLLSYSGLRDPYSNERWGRVAAGGFALGTRWTPFTDWVVHVDFSRFWLDGEDVAANTARTSSLSLSRDLGIDGFDHFTLGPRVDWAAYDENLSQFTLGHGGYDSPQRRLGLALGANFLTREGQSQLLRGDLQIGWQTRREDASPYLPLSPDGREYPASEDRGLASRLRLQAIWRLSPYWQTGLAASYEHNPAWEQAGGQAFIRYLFDPRPAVFSSDLPELP
ncbi:cellulose synthase subunit BcsC-related outer membrane protein [Plasticicumulans acidivorans]|uniref:Cellulose synthase operon protein C n=1 Tax=Plasticicumulans acidivorans TaxID=886464 RepID=A0A317MWI8_9GAMM|nr:cellulose synthase subunit BcsC-related outer membrane protein [Plasticicumulans acidivorans]PWV59139.1 cellulose synthase operon protein C [Plasticicumulans acidivorans]